MPPDTLFERITDYANRPDPYPLYAELRESGVVRQDNGSYLVGTYHEIAALLHDPRISSDLRNRKEPDPDAALARSDELPPSFIGVDDPEHDRLRRLAMRPFGPPHSPGRIDALHGDITRIAEELIHSFHDKDRIDLVDDFAYPLPVTVICGSWACPRRMCPVSAPGRTRSSPVSTPRPGRTRSSVGGRLRRHGWRWRTIWAASPKSGAVTRPGTCSPPSPMTKGPKDASHIGN